MTLEDWSIDEWFMKMKFVKHLTVHSIILDFRMRSEFEVKKKLLELGYGEAIVLEAIVKLKSLGFLNDETFSEALLRNTKNSQ